MTDNQTISIYNDLAERYAKLEQSAAEKHNLKTFMSLLPASARVLDLGCGPGRASAYLLRNGFITDPVDASQAMIDAANASYNINARKLTFDEIDMVESYDGIWANYSLLHAKREELPKYFTAIFTALRSIGVFHIAMKIGEGSGRDKLGRLYTYVKESELEGLLVEAGFDVLDISQGREIGCAGTNDSFVAIRAIKHD